MYPLPPDPSYFNVFTPEPLSLLLLNASVLQTKAPLGREPGPAQDIWPLTARTSRGARTRLHLRAGPGYHGVDPAALATQWKDPQEGRGGEGRGLCFFHLVCEKPWGQ